MGQGRIGATVIIRVMMRRDKERSCVLRSTDWNGTRSLTEMVWQWHVRGLE